MTGPLHIVDLGADRPLHYRFGVGTMEPDPFGGPGRWIRVAAVGSDVHHRVHFPRIVTESVEDIIEVGPDDDVTGL